MITLSDVPYSDLEAAALVGKLKNEETFNEAVGIFLAWVQRGELNESNQQYFDLMFQSICTHAYYLINKYGVLKRQQSEVKRRAEQGRQNLLPKLSALREIFNLASAPAVLENFTDAQREDILQWKKNAEEMENVHLSKGNDSIELTTAEKLQKLQELTEEVHTLKWMVAVSENAATQLRIMKAQLIAEQQGLHQQNSEEQKVTKNVPGEERRDMDSSTDARKKSSGTTELVTVRETKLIVLMSSILTIERTADLGKICMLLQGPFPGIQSSEVETVLRKRTNVFQEKTIGSGAYLQKEWVFQPS